MNDINRSLEISKKFIKFIMRSAAVSYLIYYVTYLLIMNFRFCCTVLMPICFVMYRVKRSGDDLEEEIKEHGSIM
jgi:hypothetical protein